MAQLEARLKELDFGALFDVLLDEIRAEEATGTKPVFHHTEAPVESAASMEEVYMEDIYKRLSDLLPEPSEAGAKEGINLSDPEFDEDLYEQLKPLFTAVMNHIQKKAT